MNYKTIFLTMLFVPIAAMGRNTVDTRIQRMEENIFQKQLELSKLGALITEKDKLLYSFKSESHDVFRLIIDKRMRALRQKNDGNALPQEEEARLYKSKRELDIFYTNALMTYKNTKSIEGILVNGLFEEDEFQSLKFYAIRYTIEQAILKSLVKKYEIHIQQLIALELNLKIYKSSYIANRETL